MHGGAALKTVDECDSLGWLSRRDAAEDDAMWYIDYADVTDAVHFRLSQIDQRLQQRDTSFESRKIFSCPRCRAQWTLLDVVHNDSPEGFRCENCSGVLDSAGEPSTDDCGAIRRQINFLSGMLADLDGHVAKRINLDR
jgi:transcription initiation factor TFIIE subunit alpha